MLGDLCSSRIAWDVIFPLDCKAKFIELIIILPTSLLHHNTIFCVIVKSIRFFQVKVCSLHPVQFQHIIDVMCYCT